MKLKLMYIKHFKYSPVVTKFEGTIKEFKELIKQELIIKDVWLIKSKLLSKKQRKVYNKIKKEKLKKCRK